MYIQLVSNEAVDFKKTKQKSKLILLKIIATKKINKK